MSGSVRKRCARPEARARSVTRAGLRLEITAASRRFTARSAISWAPPSGRS